MNPYISRVIDSELQLRMSAMGAVLMEGPKAVGKTRSASEVSKSILRLDIDRAVRAALDIHPDQVFTYPTPILFDEWQESPEIWDLVRHKVDDSSQKGLYLLAGSARPRDNARVHSGAGRIGRVRMRPMSLFETGHSTGEVSLQLLLQGEPANARPSMLTIPDLLNRIVVGGWPDLFEAGEAEARIWLHDYLQNVYEVDLPDMGIRRNPHGLQRLFTSLARTSGAPINKSRLRSDTGGDEPIAMETLNNYLESLDRLMLTEELPAWAPHMRSRTRLRTKPIIGFTDPSLALAALGGGVNDLLKDLESAGIQFENMVLRDLRVYAQALGARLSYWRDSQTGAEVDVILELPDGQWAAFEINLGESAVEQAARALLNFSSKVDTERHGEAISLTVITGGRFSYRRDDGVNVVSVACLGP
ncbi:MAG: DUF4143 domain-containing protein [Ancrocorticia sp.]